MDAVQKGDFENAKAMLADDFQFSGPVPEPINKEAWLGMSASLKAAFPDLDYHFKVIGAEGDVIRSTTQLSGTHSGSFDLTNMKAVNFFQINEGTVEKSLEKQLKENLALLKELPEAEQVAPSSEISSFPNRYTIGRRSFYG